MTLVLSGDLVAAAAAEGRGVLAFNVITLEHIEGVVEGVRRAHPACAPIPTRRHRSWQPPEWMRWPWQSAAATP